MTTLTTTEKIRAYREARAREKAVTNLRNWSAAEITADTARGITVPQYELDWWIVRRAAAFEAQADSMDALASLGAVA